MGNEVRGRAGLGGGWGADGRAEEGQDSHAASPGERLESPLRTEWTLRFTPAVHSFPLLVLAPHFPW